MKKTILTILTMTLITSSCAPVLIAGGTTAAYDERTLSTIYQDEGITHQALGLINENESFKDSNINVISINNIALLVGQVPNNITKELATKEVRSIPEVKKVYNQITIGKTTSALTRSNDTWITTKVKAAMLAENGVQSTQVKVLTENGVVYLLGIVTDEEANLAANVTKNIKGVKKVVKLFQIKKEENKQE
ncbi:MAG: BON domain-containing protein [Legionellales bacterium]|jgi:osmotically-inducible protein OsmY|nr:BON domain-containing protein [Legionellales bacterium]